ncbi:MAG: molybdopterin-dependent oxidoreductase, partial [Myxococcota bacterium]
MKPIPHAPGGARLHARVVSRRGLLEGAAAAAALLTLPACADEHGDNALPDAIPPITPNADFYVTSYQGTPEVDAATWALVVSDRGEERARIDLAGLEALGGRDKEHTLECIGANVYHFAIGNAVWTGLPLVELFEALGVEIPEGVTEVVIRSADDYHTSLPIS